MRILAISSWWPEPADNGSRLRIARLLQSLGHAHEVHLVAFTDGPAPRAQRAKLAALCATVHPVERPARPIRTSDRLIAMTRGQPASVAAGWSAPFAKIAFEQARAVRPELVIAFQPAVAEIARRIPGVPRILEEVELTLLREQFTRQHGLRRRLRYGLTWFQHRRYMAGLLSDFDACTAVSAREAELIRAIAPPSLTVAVIPNGADVQPRILARPEPDTLIYPGALSYAPNLDAMSYFLRAIFPALRAARPALRLTITGHVTEAQRAILPVCEGVRLSGFVEDIRALIASSWAEVVPLREGGGTRLKILEALALGTPVVATSKGAEGLELTPGRDLLVADTPEQFVSTTLALLSQPGLREALATAGHRAVAANHDWTVIGRRLDELLRSVVPTRSAPNAQRAA